MKQYSLFPVLMLFSLPAWAGTEICGEITAPMSLSRSQSPIYVTGDLYIPRGSRLTLQAGTTLLISPRGRCKNGEVPQWDYADSQRVSIKVDGALFISGMPGAPVQIKPEKPLGSRVMWDGIRLRNRSSKVVQIEYLQISGADRALRAENSSFGVSNSLFENNNVGIQLRSAGDLYIFNNVFAQNGSLGIDQAASCPYVQANIFWRNGDAGVRSDSRKSPVITHNLFWQNGSDCYLCPAGTRRLVSGSKDKFENIFADPVWLGSSQEKLRAQRDPANPTPVDQVRDPVLAQVASGARNQGKMGVDKVQNFRARGSGPYQLSRYSPAIHAAPSKFFFNNPDGSRGDLGMHGGTPDRTGQEYPE